VEEVIERLQTCNDYDPNGNGQSQMTIDILNRPK